MEPPEKSKDLVVVVPGILGSRLARIDDGKATELWGTGTMSVVKNIVTFGRRIKALAIPPDVDPDNPEDDIKPIGLVTDPAFIPDFVEVFGYDSLIADLPATLDVTEDQVVGFAYDWRLSNRVNGALLTGFLDEQLAGWRERSGQRDARAVLLAHSMGGLVSRWCIEKAGGYGLVSRLVTFGTPFRGAAKALDAMANGFKLPKRVGPDFTDLVWSLPSVHELLPRYACVRDGSTDLHYLEDVSVLPAEVVGNGKRFHDSLNNALIHTGPGGTVDLDVIVGSRQPTLTTAAIQPDNGIKIFESSDGTEDGPDDRGDGTVPTDAALPPEWATAAQARQARAMAQSHGSIHASEAAKAELGWMYRKAPRLKGEEIELGLRSPSVVPAGADLEVWIDASPNLSLGVDLRDLDTGQVTQAHVVQADGRYRARVKNVSAGSYAIVAGEAQPPGQPVVGVARSLVAYTEE